MARRTRTAFKLEEAKLFLMHLERDTHHVPKFYLSAFISAARSVTWVMRYEFGKKKGWEGWFEKRQPPSHLRESLRKMNDLRVRAQKTEPIRTRTTLQVFVPPEYITPRVNQYLDPSANLPVRIEPTNRENTEANLFIGSEFISKCKIERVTHELPEFEGEDALKVCRDYFNELEGLVQECDEAFNA
jgi:hypothetical protein